MQQILKKTPNPQRASTLIEVLVAMTIVATILTALGSMMAMSVKVAQRNEMEQLALMQAQETMEYFRKERNLVGWDKFFKMIDTDEALSLCFNTLPANISEMPTDECGDDLVTIELASFDFQREVTITRTVNLTNPSQNALQARVDIYRGVKTADKEPFLSLSQDFRPY